MTSNRFAAAASVRRTRRSRRSWWRQARSATCCFEQQKAPEPWNAHGGALGLDVKKFEKRMTAGKHAAAIREDMAEAVKADVMGTPAFLIAVTDPSDPKKVTGLFTLRGAQPFDRFKAELDQALAAAGK